MAKKKQSRKICAHKKEKCFLLIDRSAIACLCVRLWFEIVYSSACFKCYTRLGYYDEISPLWATSNIACYWQVSILCFILSNGQCTADSERTTHTHTSFTMINAAETYNNKKLSSFFYITLWNGALSPYCCLSVCAQPTHTHNTPDYRPEQCIQEYTHSHASSHTACWQPMRSPRRGAIEETHIRHTCGAVPCIPWPLPVVSIQLVVNECDWQKKIYTEIVDLATRNEIECYSSNHRMLEYF